MREEIRLSGKSTTIGLCLFFLGCVGLVWVSQADVFGRGLYRDDFAYGKRAVQESYFEAAAYLREKSAGGGRLFIAYTNPLIYRLFSHENLLQSNTAGLHGALLAVHVFNAFLLWLLLRRLALSHWAAGIGGVVFLAHPAGSSALFWAAAAYGYGMSIALFLSGWHCLICRRGRWSAAGYLLWLGAALGVEQFIILEILVWLTLVWSHVRWPTLNWRPVLLHLAAIGIIVASFWLAHFGPGGSTTARIAHYEQRDSNTAMKGANALGHTLRTVLWRLSTLPVGSAYTSSWKAGRHMLGAGNWIALSGAVGLTVVGLLLLCLELRRGHAAGQARNSASLSLAGLGLVLALGALLPFIYLGLGAGPARSTVVVMLGVSLFSAAIVHMLLQPAAARTASLAATGLVLVYFLISSAVINVGTQGFYRQSWAAEKRVITELGRTEFKGNELVILTGRSAAPFHGRWDLFNVVHWLTGMDSVQIWTPYAKTPRPRPAVGQRVIRLHVP